MYPVGSEEDNPEGGLIGTTINFRRKIGVCEFNDSFKGLSRDENQGEDKEVFKHI